MELCERASSFDWLYFSLPVLSTGASIAVDSQVLKYNSGNVGPVLGAAWVGFSWGWTLGSLYLSLPKCSPDYLPATPPEGNVRSIWELATAFALLSGASAPMIVGTETGPIPTQWPVSERVVRLIVGGTAGALGALFPYVLPPRTWSAARELQRIRLAPAEVGAGGFVSYGFRF
jgi:hypothetical protein